jgi:peptidoglycan/xylan/chitin deacetylase (PgdA/CDA1 family)
MRNPNRLPSSLLPITLLATLCTGCTILTPGKWPAGSRQIILTFDDGPSTHISEELLDVLSSHAVPASFCYIGKNIDLAPQIARRTLDDGHEVVFHSYSHTSGALLSRKQLLAEFDQFQNALNRAADRPVSITRYRPPLGINTPPVLAANKALQLQEAYLTFFVNDASTEPDSADQLMQKIKRRLIKNEGGAIVLHEMRYKANQDPYAVEKSWLPDAVDDLIIWAKANGFTFTTYAAAPNP